MEEVPFFVPHVNQLYSAVDGKFAVSDQSEILWAMSRKEFGPMSFLNRPDWDIAHNRMQFLRLFNLKIDNVISPRLCHGTTIKVVGKKDRGKGARRFDASLLDVDGLVTNDPDLILLTTHADCMPLWMVAPDTGWIGIAHVGWRGLLDGIVDSFIDAVPGDQRSGMVLGLGPSIDRKNYQVGDEVAELFADHPFLKACLHRENDATYLDLPGGVKLCADKREVHSVDTPWLSTFDNDYLSSYRRDGEGFLPMAAIITRVTK